MTVFSSSQNDHDSGVSVSPKNSPELSPDELRIRAGPIDQIGTIKGTMREFISSEAGVIMKNLKVKKRVSLKIDYHTLKTFLGKKEHCVYWHSDH